MPVTFDNAATAKTSSAATTIQFTLTSAATAKVVLVWATPNGGSKSLSTMSFANVGMTRIGTIGTGTRFELWGLTAPAAGSNTVSATFAADAAGIGWMFVAATYNNVTDANPWGTFTGQTAGSVTNVNYSISSSATDLVVVGFQTTGALTGNNGTTDISATTSVGNITVIHLTGNAGATTVSATIAVANTWSINGLSLHFSAAAAATFGVWKALGGVGL